MEGGRAKYPAALRLIPAKSVRPKRLVLVLVDLEGRR
jgi:hypothetical protein